MYISSIVINCDVWKSITDWMIKQGTLLIITIDIYNNSFLQLGTPIKYAAAWAVPNPVSNEQSIWSKFGPTASDKEKLRTKPSNRFYSKQSPPHLKEVIAHQIWQWQIQIRCQARRRAGKNKLI